MLVGTASLCKGSGQTRVNTTIQHIAIRHIAAATPLASLSYGNIQIPCAIGSGGIRRTKYEGDGVTPSGRWPLRRVLYRPDRVCRPVSSLPVQRIEPRLGWCDDPASRHYNQPVALPFPARHESMWRDDALYDLVVVVGYNDSPPTRGAGSAIFIHISSEAFRATHGCIGLQRRHLVCLIKHLGPKTQLIVPD
jgi:L,D-peptidoglycan transpeptidase YkuD (ErfK/YbiS/YcfS/YnhG family)